MKCWKLGGRPELLPENEDDELDDDSGFVEP